MGLNELSRRALASGRLETSAPLEDLAAFDVPHLDETDLRSRRRDFTQAIARALFDEGAAGVIYPSNIDNGRCVALFERRGEVVAGSVPRPLPDLRDEVAAICQELGLTLVD